MEISLYIVSGLITSYRTTLESESFLAISYQLLAISFLRKSDQILAAVLFGTLIISGDELWIEKNCSKDMLLANEISLELT